MALERAFVKAGGLLIAGTDPTGSGGVVPGFADQRQIELLVEAGFTPLEAIAIGTSNGAKYLGRDARIGTIADRQTGRPRRAGRQPGGVDWRYQARRDGVQERRRLRSREADRIRARTGGGLVGSGMGRMGRKGRMGQDSLASVPAYPAPPACPARSLARGRCLGCCRLEREFLHAASSAAPRRRSRSRSGRRFRGSSRTAWPGAPTCRASRGPCRRGKACRRALETRPSCRGTAVP